MSSTDRGVLGPDILLLSCRLIRCLINLSGSSSKIPNRIEFRFESELP